ncbi:MAG: hypothetical protein ACJAUV_001114 [Flavobacteriales bacterium]|jgi:hypothetical protein
MRFKHIITCVFIVFLAIGCYKENTDVSALNTNPWDMDYNGDDLITIDSAYFDSTSIKRYITKFDTIDSVNVVIDSTITTLYTNTLILEAESHLFDDNLSTSYSVWIKSSIGSAEFLNQNSYIENHHFKYQIVTEVEKIEICYLFALYRNESKGKQYSFCNTNPY